MSAGAIEVRDLSKQYRIAAKKQAGYETLRDSIAGAVRRVFAKREAEAPDLDLWALKNISFDIGPGETVGIIGRNGAGKSTLLKVLSRITEPSSGYAKITGRVGSLLEVGTGFHPELSGRENIFLNGAILGMKRTETAEALDDIVAFAEIDRMLDTPVKHYSSGMYMRLAFAVAAHLKPEIMLVDEVLAVGDVAFQKKCLGKMGSVARTGRTVLFVSHNMQAVRQLCQRAVWLKDGKVIADGPSGEVVDAYLREAPETESQTELAKSIDALPADPVFKLRSINVLQDGLETLEILNGKPVEIRFEYEVATTTPGLHLTIDLCDAEGSLIFQTLSNGDSDQLPVVERGHHVSRAIIPADFLAPMPYELRFTAGIANVRGVVPPMTLRLQVHASGRVNRAYPGYSTPGKLAPLIPWATETQELSA
jgi:lipopolysaccharide transport system ATP-binding protein